MKKCISVALLFLLLLGLYAQEKKEEPVLDESGRVEIDTSANIHEPVVKYIIDAQLLPEKSELRGTEILTWVNKSSAAVNHLRFHLYYNAFRHPETTFMREWGIHKRSKQEIDQLQFGGMEIVSIRMIGGRDLTPTMRFVSPDDNNPHDRTVMQVALEEALQPMQSLSVQVEFVLKIPQIFARTGRAGDYFFLAQWFPRIGVLQKDGEWHCHQFHYLAKFFSDYGDYKVSLTLPGRFVVGASGSLVKSEKKGDKKTLFFEEQNIHDFAWTAYPHFETISKKIRLPGSVRDSSIVLLLSPHHRAARARYMNAVTFALRFYAEHIFPYPYKQITLVDPPLPGLLSGGMGYPTLMTLGYVDFLPASLKASELLVFHELGHQYWYGLVGSDGSREAWLGEGVTRFFDMEIADEYFKNSASFLDSALIKIDFWHYMRMRYLTMLPVDRANRCAWQFLDSSQYSKNVYAKAGLLLRSLKNYVGKEKMVAFFKFYAQKFKFRHAAGGDFCAAFSGFMNEDFSWAFDQFIKGEAGVDHAVHSLDSQKIAAAPDRYRNEVVFLRKEGYFPVDLEITLADGKKIKAFWKEREKWKRIVTINDTAVEYAAVDPEFKVVLDKNFLNNSLMRRKQGSGLARLALKLSFLFQQVLGFLIL